MDAFGILGLTFGSMGFFFALIAVVGIKKLTDEVKTLSKKVQALEEGGKEA